MKVMKEVLPNTPSVGDTFCFNSPVGEPHSLGTALGHVEGKSSQVVEPTPEDLAGLIYTSGTTVSDQ